MYGPLVYIETEIYDLFISYLYYYYIILTYLVYISLTLYEYEYCNCITKSQKTVIHTPTLESICWVNTRLTHSHYQVCAIPLHASEK